MKHINAFFHARTAAKAADDKLGEDIVVLDVRRQTAMADCFLFVTGSSHIHIRAIEDEIREMLKSSGAELRRTDGQRGHVWRALDYGGLIIHIMDRKTREFYSIERLWDEAKRVGWTATVKAARKRPARKKHASRAKPKSSRSKSK